MQVCIIAWQVYVLLSSCPINAALAPIQVKHYGGMHNTIMSMMFKPAVLHVSLVWCSCA
jgi:hypothetical protein